MPSEIAIDDAFREGFRRWPEISLSRQRFGELVLDTGATEGGLQRWGAELYLACAAASGDATAVRQIDELYIARLPARIRRLGATADRVPDVLQAVRARLFVGPAPRILGYDARAPLEQWIKVVAIRTAIDMHRTETAGPRAEAEWLATLSAHESDAATTLIRQEHKAAFEEALRDQLGRLSPRDRTILRLHVVEGVSVETLATSYGVHRVTVARWIWNAGERVLDGIRLHFRERFGVIPHEFDSLARLMRSQLSLKVSEVLGG
jgi:RNA polymerase sigma-70 factor (ECF subfamily)